MRYNTLIENTPHTPSATPAIRHDGWTVQRQRVFLEHLARTGNVSDSAIEARVSASSAYRMRRHPRHVAFRTAWDAALEIGGQRLADVAMQRATRGEKFDLFDKDGVYTGSRVKYDNRLLMFMLARLDPVRFGVPSLEARARAAAAGDALVDGLDALADAPEVPYASCLTIAHTE